MKANLKLATSSLVLLLVVSACSAPKTAPSTTDNKGVMTHNQNVTIYQTTRLSTVDISKVSSFGMLSSSTEGLFRLGKNGHVGAGRILQGLKIRETVRFQAPARRALE